MTKAEMAALLETSNQISGFAGDGTKMPNQMLQTNASEASEATFVEYSKRQIMILDHDPSVTNI